MRKDAIIGMRSGSLLLLLGVVAGCFLNTPDGAMLFKGERCIYCHTFKGQGAKIGPDLTNVTKKRTDQWLRNQIRDPKLHYPNPGMPGHEYLSDREITAIIKYLKC